VAKAINGDRFRGKIRKEKAGDRERRGAEEPTAEEPTADDSVVEDSVVEDSVAGAASKSGADSESDGKEHMVLRD
jgi:hypothetical protein